jgi:hypothetical protein
MKNMFGQLFQSLSGDVQVITSSMSRAEDEVLRFQKESEPRIALSTKGIQRRVSMLDLALKSKVNQLWNKFWSGRLTNHLQSIEYIPYFLFTSYLESFRQGLSAIIPTYSIKTKNLILM